MLHWFTSHTQTDRHTHSQPVSTVWFNCGGIVRSVPGFWYQPNGSGLDLTPEAEQSCDLQEVTTSWLQVWTPRLISDTHSSSNTKNEVTSSPVNDL